MTERELADAAQLASLADETPEGRSIVVLAKEKYGIRGRDMAAACRASSRSRRRRRMSGVDVGSSWIRKGAVDAVLSFLATPPAAVASTGAVRQLQPVMSGEAAREISAIAERIAKAGGTPLAVARTAACSASSTSRTSSRAASASASRSCAPWASAPS